MRQFGILICLVQCFGGIFCASGQSSRSISSAVFTGAYSDRFADAFSFISNPALLAGCKNPAAGVYGEDKFGLKELKNYTAAFSMGINKKDGFGILVSYAGTTEFNQSQVGIGYGKNLGRVNIGLRFNYNMVRIEGYGNAGVITYEIGSIVKITDKFYSGIQVINPQGGKYDTEKLPAIYTVGVGYECSDQLLITAAIMKEENKPVIVQAGIQYIFAESLYAALGMNSSISSPAILIGWQRKGMRIFMTGSFHAMLGFSTGVGILFSGKKREESAPKNKQL